MGIKLTSDGTFKRTVTIAIPHPVDADRVLSGNIVVTYNDLDAEQVEALAKEQADSIREASEAGARGEGAGLSLDALRISIRRVVKDVDGFEVDGSEVHGESAIEALCRFWGVGKAVNDEFWLVKKDPRKRRPN